MISTHKLSRPQFTDVKISSIDMKLKKSEEGRDFIESDKLQMPDFINQNTLKF